MPDIIKRTIKFRGFNRKNNQWIYGFYLQNRGAHFVCPDELATGRSWEDYEIDPETLGQYTGLTTGSGDEVYEGDIIGIDGSPELGIRLVVFYEESFNVATCQDYSYLLKGVHPYFNDYTHMTCLNEWSSTGLVRVIGNIHENPEQLIEK